MNKDTYFIGAIITGLISFVGVWIYAISSWGFLFGIMFGWIPAIITAIIAGVLWPLLLAIIVIFVGWLLINS